MSQSTQIAFTDLRVRGARKEHGNCTFLGYADATLVVNGALQIRFRGIELKVLNGTFRIDFKSEQGSDEKWYPMVFPKTKESRKALTSAMLAAYRKHVAEQKDDTDGISVAS